MSDNVVYPEELEEASSKGTLFVNNEGKRDYAKFRAKGAAGFLTRSLFADVMAFFQIEDHDEAPYYLERNIKDDDRLVMRDHFIVSNDPTGYETAIKFLGCYEHWEAMYKRCQWFKEAVERWKRELQSRQKAAAIQKILDIALSDTPQALAAAKYIAALDYEKDETARGRPSKAEVRGRLKEQVRILEEDTEDLKRIGIVK